MTVGRSCMPVAPDVVLLLTEGGLVDVDAAVVGIAMTTSGLGLVVGLAVAFFSPATRLSRPSSNIHSGC